MNPGINRKFFLKNALLLSTVAHGVGLYILVNWTTEVHSPEGEPIHITKIIFEPKVHPKKKEVARPAEEILAEVHKHPPAHIQQRKKIKQVQPIVASTALDQMRRDSFSTHNSKPVKSFKLQTTQPALIQEEMPVNKIRAPLSFVQPVRVAESVTVKPGSLPTSFQAGKLNNKSRQPDYSIRPVNLTGRVASSANSWQRVSVARESSNTAPKAHAEVRIVSSKKSSFVDSRRSIQVAGHKTRTVYTNRIHPVQLASLPTNLVEESGELEKKPLSGPQAVDPSGENLASLKKEFSSGIWRKIAATKYYPNIAQKRRWEGKPVIEFQVGRNGDLLDYSVAVASPYAVLDQAAIDAVKNASPYPKIPESLKLNSIRFKLPIAFKLD
ncbi:MAG: energy transducer TonB [Nitrospina sp.]|nr:energy transducer TonB [Nitrospina sp.]